MTDLEIFDKWHKTTIAQISITENWQVGAILEFAKYYHTEQLKLCEVSQQRELLIAYCKHILDECTDEDKITIDEFLHLQSNL